MAARKILYRLLRSICRVRRARLRIARTVKGCRLRIMRGKLVVETASAPSDPELLSSECMRSAIKSKAEKGRSLVNLLLSIIIGFLGSIIAVGGIVGLLFGVLVVVMLIASYIIDKRARRKLGIVERAIDEDYVSKQIYSEAKSILEEIITTLIKSCGDKKECSVRLENGITLRCALLEERYLYLAQ